MKDEALAGWLANEIRERAMVNDVPVYVRNEDGQEIIDAIRGYIGRPTYKRIVEGGAKPAGRLAGEKLT